MPNKKLKTFLDENMVKYVTINHSKAYTAQEIVASLHIKGKKFAKTVMLNVDGQMAMAVLPASYRVNLLKLRDTLHAEDIQLAEEQNFKDIFPGCEIGAMPPFGNLYDLPVYVAASLVADEDIYFNAGTHTELVKMRFNDYETLVEPEVVRFSYKPA
ncbi:MAG: YbaK/EbsC family protein [bacterium]